MLRVIDVHELDLIQTVSLVRDEIKRIGNNTIVIIHGYGSVSNSYKKLEQIRNIGRSQVKKGNLKVCISGPDLNDPSNRVYFDSHDLNKLLSYVVNSGVTIMKK